SVGHAKTAKRNVLLRAAGAAETKEGAEAPGPAAGPRLSTVEAVRRALLQLGDGATPEDIVARVEAGLGPDISRQDAAQRKSHILLHERPAAGAGAEQGPAAGATVAPGPTALEAPPARTGTGNGTGIALADLQALKGLLGRVGAEQVR